MNDQPSIFPLLAADDDVTIDGIDLLAEIEAAEQEKRSEKERRAEKEELVERDEPVEDELTIDGAQLAEELLAESENRLAGPTNPGRWQPPSGQQFEEIPSPAPPNGKIQLTAALVAVFVCLGLAAWIWEGSSGSLQPDPPPAVSGESE